MLTNSQRNIFMQILIFLYNLMMKQLLKLSNKIENKYSIIIEGAEPIVPKAVKPTSTRRTAKPPITPHVEIPKPSIHVDPIVEPKPIPTVEPKQTPVSEPVKPTAKIETPAAEPTVKPKAVVEVPSIEEPAAKKTPKINPSELKVSDVGKINTEITRKKFIGPDGELTALAKLKGFTSVQDVESALMEAAREYRGYKLNLAKLDRQMQRNQFSSGDFIKGIVFDIKHPTAKTYAGAAVVSAVSLLALYLFGKKSISSKDEKISEKIQAQPVETTPLLNHVIYDTDRLINQINLEKSGISSDELDVFNTKPEQPKAPTAPTEPTVKPTVKPDKKQLKYEDFEADDMNYVDDNSSKLDKIIKYLTGRKQVLSELTNVKVIADDKESATAFIDKIIRLESTLEGMSKNIGNVIKYLSSISIDTAIASDLKSSIESSINVINESRKIRGF